MSKIKGITKRKIASIGVLMLLSVPNKLAVAQNGAASGTHPGARISSTISAPAAVRSSFNSPEFLRARLAKLQKSVPLRYNKHVHKHIKTLTTTHREHVQKMLERQHLYFPVFEEALNRYSLPVELKYLSVVESSLNPRAVSPVKAAGLWQFMPSVGASFGLQQDAYIDERLDPEKATLAATCYLKMLYNMFDNWELALAAYNAGPGRVRRAIRRAGNRTTFAAIAPHLPSETQAYVPAFVATTFVMSHHHDYNIYPDTLAQTAPVDTMQVTQPLNLSVLASHLGVPLVNLKKLNPAFKGNLVPAFVKTYTLRIPGEARVKLISRRQAILDAATPRLTSTLRQALLASNISAAIRQQTYLMETFSGMKKVAFEATGSDNLMAVAEKYQVDVTTLAGWNYLTSHNLRTGQKLVVYLNRSGVQPDQIITSEADKMPLIGQIAGKRIAYQQNSLQIPRQIASPPANVYAGLASNGRY